MTTTSDELQKFLSKEPGFLGIFMSNELPEPTKHSYSFISNYDPNTREGTHWVAFKSNGNLLQYFDSFGLSPDFDDFLLNDKTHFKKWLHEHNPGSVKINRFDYQMINRSTCGEWCCMFIKKPTLLADATRKPIAKRDDFVQGWYNSEVMENSK